MEREYWLLKTSVMYQPANPDYGSMAITRGYIDIGWLRAEMGRTAVNDLVDRGILVPSESPASI